MLRQCDGDIFSCYDSDGSTIFDGYYEDGMWDHNAVRRRQMTVRGEQVLTFGAANESREEATYQLPQSSKRLATGTDAHEHFKLDSWTPSWNAKGTIEHHIAGRRHIIALQGSVQHLQHEYVTRQFHETHFNGCAVLFYKHTFEPDIKVKATRTPTDKVPGWAFEAILSKGSYSAHSQKRQNRNFTMMSLHCESTFAKKRSMDLNIFLAVRTVTCQENVDLAAGDFNGASWRRKPGPQRQLDGTIEDMFQNAKLPSPPSPSPLWEPGGVPAEWSVVCGFV